MNFTILGPLPAADGPRVAVLRFAPTDTRLLDVRLEGVAAEPLPGRPRHFAVRVGSNGAVAPLTVDVRYEGDAPYLLEGKFALEQGSDPETLLRRLEDRLGRITPFGRKNKLRLFFLRYDALTDPTLLAHLKSGAIDPKGPRVTRHPGLRGLLQDVPELDFEPCAIFLLLDLMLLSLEMRALRGLGKPWTWNSNVWLAGNECPCGRAVSPAATIKCLARFQRVIFDREFPAPGGRVSPHLIAAFAAFANGRLGYVEGSERAYYNAEPDSIAFFALAEFALRASQELSDAGESEYWAEMFGALVPLEDVFVARYGRVPGPRTRAAYHLLPDEAGRSLSNRAVRGLIEYYERRYPCRAGLEERHGANFLLAIRDELP